LALLYFCAPLLLTFGATFATMAWHRGREESWNRSRVALWLLVADLAVLTLAWVLIARAPDVTTGNGVCKDLSDFDTFYALVFGSAAVGGTAWGTASLQRDSSGARLLGYAAVAIAVPYVIAIRAFVATGCTWN
jgi:hypothetical protein